MSCQICNSSIALPYTLECGDTFCFLCIKTHGDMNCPVCGKFITDDLNNVHVDEEPVVSNNYQWLYSSMFGDRWWCYDDSSNKKIEAMHKHYVKSDDIEIKIVKTTKSHHSVAEQTSHNFSPIIPTTSQQFIFFGDFSTDSSGESEDEDVTHTIHIGNTEYMVDFDDMKQINIDDPRKMRRIKRLSIPSSSNVIDFLKQNHVIGVAGMKY